MGNYLIIRIIASIFVIYALLKVIKKYRDKSIYLKELLFWAIVWLAIGFVFWLPNFTTLLANILGIGRGADLVIYSSIIIIFYLIFRIYVVLDKQQQEITKIVRHLAISEEEKKKEN